MITRTVQRTILATLLVSVAAAVLLVLLPRAPERVVVQANAIGPFIADGETAWLRNFFGFENPERDGDLAFRWTTGEGSFIVRNGTRLGEPLVLRLELCGCRVDETPAPWLQIRVNGETLVETTASAQWGDWRSYALLIPPVDAPYYPDLFLEILSDYTANPDSGRPMGVAFERAVLETAQAQPAYTLPSAITLALLIGAVVPLALVRGRSLVRAAGVALLALALVAAQGYLYRSHPLPPLVLALALLGGILLALVLLPAQPHQRGGAAWLRGALPFGSLVLLFSTLVLAIQILGAWMLDDSFISFRYARNALFGHGLVFNPGERVEGYTNFLWTVLFIPIIGGGLSPDVASQVLTLLIALLTAGLVWVGAQRVAGSTAALVALALLVVSTPFVLYTARGSGMETALFTLLILAGALTFGRWLDRHRTTEPQPHHAARLTPHAPLLLAGLLFGFAAMTRPEGVLVTGISGLYLLILSAQVRRVLWQPMLALSAGFLIIFGPYYLWRFSYYGYPLPNTFYAKVGSTSAQVWRGADYAADFALSQAPLLLLALVAVGLALRRAGDTRALRVRYLGLVTGCYTAYIIAVGGDHFPYYRFFVPLIPLFVLLAAGGVAQLGQRLPRAVALPVLAVFVAAGVVWQAPQLHASRTLNAEGRVWGENSVVEKNREIGLWLRENTAPGTLVATGIAGALPYYSDLPVIDALGLNDLHIAHLEVPTIGQGVAGSEKTDVEYILGRRPDYIPHNTIGPFRGNPEFHDSYRLMILRGPEGRGIRMYRRADLPLPATARSLDEEAAQ